MQAPMIGIKCSACQLDLGHRIYPCDHGCTQVVYCDRTCADTDWTLYHYAECGGLQEVVRNVGSFPLHVFRMISRVGGPEEAYRIRQNKENYGIEQYLKDDAQREVPEQVSQRIEV